MRRDPRRAGVALVSFGAAALAAAAVGVAWAADARQRERERALLHRTLVELLLNALSAGDAFTERHSRRVADLTDALAASYGLDRRTRALLRVAALLHDMGKIDDQFFDIIHSTEPLEPAQRSQIKRHPHESAYILEPLERFHPGLMRIVESHHERWDGKGYPLQLEGEQIPLGARIISVADVFDALAQSRSYKAARTVAEALEEIRRCAGQRFDPEVVARLERPEVLRRWTRIAEQGWAEEAQAAGGGSEAVSA